MVVQEYEADVLVVGAGLAGLRAAARATREGKSVLVVSKGNGASGGVLAFNALLPDTDDAGRNLFFDDMMQSGGGINSRPLVETFVELSCGLLASLEEYGYAPDRDENGNFRRRHLGGSSTPRSFFSGDATGGVITGRLWNWLRNHGVRELPGVDVFLPVLADGQIAGVLGTRLSNGEMVAVSARSVILAGGGVGRLIDGSTYPHDVDGSCEALGLLAGAELVDMEFIQFEPTVCFTHPAINRMEMPTAMLGDGAVLKNAQGERFMRRYGCPTEAGVEKGFLARCIQKEIDAGRGGAAGGIYCDAREISPAVLGRYALRVQRLLDAGVDLKTDMVEVKPVAHSHMGGIRIDANTMTRVPGLFAVGECSGGLHGASRIAGNGGAEVLVMGDASGAAASLYATDASQLKPESFRGAVDTALMNAELHFASAPISGESIRQAGELLAQSCTVFRRPEAMERCVASLHSMNADDGGTMPLPDAVRTRANLFLATAIATAALQRQESRGAHARIDYPEQREEWNGNIVHSLECDAAHAELACRFERLSQSDLKKR